MPILLTGGCMYFLVLMFVLGYSNLSEAKLTVDYARERATCQLLETYETKFESEFHYPTSYSGYPGISTWVSPDFVAGEKANPNVPIVGISGPHPAHRTIELNGQFFDFGKCDSSYYGIFRVTPEGYVQHLLFEEKEPQIQEILKTNPLNLIAPFQGGCTSQDIDTLLSKINGYKLRSQKFLIAKYLRHHESCKTHQAKIEAQLKTFERSPLVSIEADPVDLEKHLRDTGCTNFSKESNHIGEPYISIFLQSGEQEYQNLLATKSGSKWSFYPKHLFTVDESGGPLLNQSSDSCVKSLQGLMVTPTATKGQREIVRTALRYIQTYLDSHEISPPITYGPQVSDEVVTRLFGDAKVDPIHQGRGSFSSDEPLYTGGLLSCIGLAVQNENSQKGFMIHADFFTDVETLASPLLEKLGQGKLTAYIGGGSFASGGEYPSPLILYRIMKFLEDNNIPVRAIKKNKNAYKTGFIGMDPKTGDIY